MSFAPRRLAAFAAAICIALAGTMVLPGRERDGYMVERATGRHQPLPWRQLVDWRRQGDLGLLAAGVDRLRARHESSAVLAGLRSMIDREICTPDFDGDPLVSSRSERYFEGVIAPEGLDARAARMQVRLEANLPVSVDQLILLADRFEARGRGASRWRWLSRAFARDRGSIAAADGLVQMCVAHGRLAEAVSIAMSHSTDRSRDLAWQRRLAELGAWLGRTELEVQALEHIVAVESDPMDRGRLIELYAHLGEPERALPHAVAIADGAAETAAAESAAHTALKAGFVDEGLAMLRRAAERAPVASPWLQRFADLAMQDLRVDDVTRALESAAAYDPGSVDERLEDLYRRTDQPEQLADLLQRRLARAPDDERLWHELITLRAALGQREEAELLARQRVTALADPESFVASLPVELRAEAGRVRNRVLALSLSSPAEGAVIGETLEQLRPFFAQPAFRDLAELLLSRYPDDPRAKGMRRELVDIGRSPAQATVAARALSATYPDDPELARLWLERAQWAELVPAQLAARERLVELVPEDRENRYELADLLELKQAYAAALVHWNALVDAEGIRSEAVPRLIDTLFAEGLEDEAVVWLQRLADDPAASAEQRLLAADELFYQRSYDRARVLYAAVLAEQPTNTKVLLRLGQVATWTNDPRAALPFFERHLAVSEDDTALVRFYLGEALWALGERARATAQFGLALAEFRQLPAPDFIARSCMATMMARLGYREEARAAYRDLVARSPRDVDLVLDYADMVLQDGELALVRALAAHARKLAPEETRVLRLEASIAVASGDHEAADRAYGRILSEVGSDATVLGDQCHLRIDSGNWAGALAKAERLLEVQPDSIAARRTHHTVRELLADFSAVDGAYRRVGRDRMSSLSVGGVVWFDDRTWLQGRIAAVSQRGVTSLGSGEAKAEYTRLIAALGMRPHRRDRLAVGLAASPGVEGDLPVGLFASGHFEWDDPGVSLQARLRLHDLLAEPMAAPGLGGRRSGFDVMTHMELGGRLWTSLHGGFDWLEIDPDSEERRSDSRWRGEAALGVRLIDGDVAVASPFDPLLVPAGPDSPFLAASPALTRSSMCNAWVGLQSAHILGDAELTRVLPLAKHDDFAIGAVRYDHHLVRSFGLSATARLGVDVHDGDFVHGIAAALTWRPAFGTEVTVSGSHGEALGRSDGGEDQQLRVEVVLRW